MSDPALELERASADIPLTRAAREILERAAAMARERGTLATPIDVLRATLSSRGSLADEAVRAVGVDPATLLAQLSADGAEVEPIPLRQLLVNANREAQVLGHYHVDSIHLLLAMLYSDSHATAAVLQKAGLTLYDVRQHLQTSAKDFLPGESDRQSTRSAPPRGRADGARPPATPRPDAALRRKPMPSLRGVIQVSPVVLGLLAATVVSGALILLACNFALSGEVAIPILGKAVWR